MIVIAALTLVALPTADARPLAGPRAIAGTSASWISALSTWVSSFFFGTTTKSTTPTMHTSAPDLSSTSGTMHTMTGSCVDPNGKPIPCQPL
jgi:hypothetical protein